MKILYFYLTGISVSIPIFAFPLLFEQTEGSGNSDRFMLTWATETYCCLK